MQSTALRSLILIGVLAIGNWLLAASSSSRVQGTARWPSDDATFAASGWLVSPAAVETANGAHFVRREYTRADGTAAELVLITSPEAKSIYKAGAEVPFLGSGYTVQQAPASIVPPAPGRTAQIARRGADQWLVLSAIGERRGFVGNGLSGWGLVAFDTLAGRRNDYFKVHILMPLEERDAASGHEAAALADTLFPRLASWYSR
jgi:hypothetical protein